MTIVERDDVFADEPGGEAVLDGTDRRSFLRIGAWTAAATAAAGVAGVATAGRAEAANGGNFLIGLTNSGTATTTLSGGSSLVASGGNSYIITGTTHAALAGITTESGGAGVYGKDSSSDGSAIGVWGDGKYGVLGRSNGDTGGSQGVRGEARFLNDIGVYGVSSNSSTTGGAWGVRGDASNLLDLGVQATHTGGGTALFSTASGSGTGAYLRSTGSGIGTYVASSTGPALVIAATGLTTVPPTTGSWSAGSMLMKGGTLFYCWKSGVGTASKWVRMSGALVALGTPKRAYDSTKSGGAIAAGTARTITVAKSSTNVPVGVSAVALSITVLRTAGSGFITAFSASASAPGTRTLSWWGGKQVHTTSTVVRLSSAGKIKIKANKNKTHVLVDVLGYYP